MLDVMNSTEYEKVAQQAYQAILATDEVETIEVLHNVQITGRSGVAHQIGVYWRYLKDGVEHQVLMECKYYKSTIDLIHARNLLGLLTDIPGSQGVLLTTMGFQSGVVNLCNFYGIASSGFVIPKGLTGMASYRRSKSKASLAGLSMSISLSRLMVRMKSQSRRWQGITASL